MNSAPPSSDNESDLQKLADAITAQVEKDAAQDLGHSINSQIEVVDLAQEIEEDLALEAHRAEAHANEGVEVGAEVPSDSQAIALSATSATAAAAIEALIFLSDKPLSRERLRALLSEEISAWGEDTWNAALEHLRQRYASDQHGIELVEMGGGFQFRTKSEHAHRIKRLAKVQTQKLSSGAMETLAIVAYKQPVMKEDIDQVRGVDSSHFVRTLLDRKLIEITGRSELPGRPMLYSTTPEFLQLFGLGSLSALPSLRELEQMVPSSVGRDAGEDADPRVREMRKLVNQMTTDVSVTLSYDPREDERFLQEIREKVQAIPTTTAFIEEQKAEDQRTALAAHLQATVVLESPSETISTQPSIG